MKYGVEEILMYVQECEDERSEYVTMARYWEDMWSLRFNRASPLPDSYVGTGQRRREQDEGKVEVVLPTPYNVVSLSTRLLADAPRIEVLPYDSTEEADKVARRKEKFLKAIWQNNQRYTGTNVLHEAKWQSFVRGRFVFDLRWVGDLLPDRLAERRFPILLRTLDPLNVGVKRGPLYTDYAYHRTEETIRRLLQLYPKLKLTRIKDRIKRQGRDAAEALREYVDVIDFWYTNPKDGTVWNAVVVEDEFAVNPRRMDYPAIPIIEGYGDSAPLADGSYHGLSILYPIMDLWPYQNVLYSQMASGLHWYFWPFVWMSNDFGMELPDVDVKPGNTQQMPMGTRIDTVRIDPNVPLAQAVMGQSDAQVQESTFPGVLYGKAPGELQAGYGVSILADAAKGRISEFRRNLEDGVAQVNSLILAMVEEFGDDELGVNVYGRDESSEAMYQVVLYPDDIQGCYDNVVQLTPMAINDETARQTLGLRYVQEGIISRQTFRTKWLREALPEDEQARIEVERAFMSEQMQPRMALEALRKYFPNRWQQIIKGTPFEQMAIQAGLIPTPPQPAPIPVPGPVPPPQPSPNGAGAPGMPPGAPPIQPPTVNEGNVAAIPPEAQGQMTPEMMGMGAQGMPPELMGQMMGQPLTPEDELRRLMGLGGPENG